MNKIDDVDVSECPLYDKNTGCYHTFNGECVQDSCAVYKWLLEYKRLQQENVKLKEKINIYENSIIANYDRAVGKRLMEVLLALEEIRDLFDAIVNRKLQTFNEIDTGKILLAMRKRVKEVLNDRN